ncbi:MAG: N-acetylglutamate synthase [Chloroflexota bacterium]|nr:N-acetylglutamate synthase [Chloroflexota bacterium]
MQIRLMQPEDYTAAVQLWQSLPGLGLSSADREEAIHTFLTRNPRTCFVAEQDGELLGTVLGGSDGRRGYLYHLAVHGDHQKQGLGRQLVQTCLDALRSEGIEKCHIFVIADNQDGLDFWQRIGWELRGDILVLSKNLPAA